jgi:hypothetical protein
LAASADRQRHGFLDRAEDDRGARPGDAEAALELVGQQRIQIAHAAAPHLQQEVVVAGDVVAFLDQRVRPHGLQERRARALVRQRHGNEREDGETGRIGIRQGGIAADHAARFELAHALGRGRCREPQRRAEVGPARAAVLYQVCDGFRIDRIVHEGQCNRWC